MFRDIFVKDFVWKLISLVLAAFIWYTVHKLIAPQSAGASNDINTVTYDNEPVLIEATAADMHLYHVKPETVSVTLSGPAEIMSVLQANQIGVRVDLSKFDPATAISQPVYVSVPGGVTLINVKPAKVDVIVPPKT